VFLVAYSCDQLPCGQQVCAEQRWQPGEPAVAAATAVAAVTAAAAAAAVAAAAALPQLVHPGIRFNTTAAALGNQGCQSSNLLSQHSLYSAGSNSKQQYNNVWRNPLRNLGQH
jgi:hypothetical protein